jgi:3-oxoacyl-[acyl-carrier protein] reductase
MILITGGDGSLAQALRECFESVGYEIAAPGRSCLDVSDRHSVGAFFRTLSEPVELVINQAGSLRDGSLLKMNEADWDKVLDAHLKGTWLVSQAYAASLQGRPGHLIQVGSYSGLVGPAGQCNYAAAKAGLIGLTQSLAREWGAQSIRSNIVLPGFLETAMTASLTDVQRAKFREDHVLGSFNTVHHVAKFVRFLHEDLPHVSGQTFQLDSRVRRPGW